MRRTLYAVATLAVLLLSSAPAMAFNVRNDTDATICVFGPDYFDVVPPHFTNRGWYYTKHKTLRLELASQNDYVCVGESHPVCAWKCNRVTKRDEIPQHAQLVVSKAICDISNKKVCPGGSGQCITACDLANYPLRFEVWINN